MDGLHTDGLRLALFLGAFALLSVLEWCLPARAPLPDLRRRWVNLALLGLGTLLLRLLLPVAALGTAALAAQHQFGLLYWLAVPQNHPLTLVGLVVALDLVIYGQHVLFHKHPWLWRVHRVHHSDLQVDTSTGVRFHPLEILVSMLIKMAAVGLLGAGVLAVLIYEIALNLMALFTHCNLRLPAGLERALRVLLVTPTMHRTHHSTDPAETDSNYGNILSCWDRLFGTYTAEPAAGAQLAIGLSDQRTPQTQRLRALLFLPWRR